MTEPQPAPRRRARSIAVVAVVATAAAATVLAALGLGGGSDEASARQPASTATTVAVQRRTLARSVTVDGQIDFGASTPLPIKATGTITWLPAAGTVVKRGRPVARVDDRPVVLLYGDLPQYRALAAARRPEAAVGATPTAAPTAGPGADGGTGAGAPSRAPSPTAKPTPTKKPAPPPPFRGNDVRQFERNLRALGYRGFTVDSTFDDATARAVKRWQRSLGLAPTGTVGLGDIVYAPGAVRIAKTGGRIGGAMAEDTVSVSGNTRVVRAAVPAENLSWAKQGAPVSVQVPEGGRTTGAVTAAGGPPPTDAGGDAGAGGDSVSVTVSVKDQKVLSGQDGAPVTVTYVSEQRRDVLCVPVPALVALAEGGYGLEPAAPGATGFVAVKTGLFADGAVEVSGAGITEGMLVRVPK